jgi:hypothetical protein
MLFLALVVNPFLSFGPSAQTLPVFLVALVITLALLHHKITVTTKALSESLFTC